MNISNGNTAKIVILGAAWGLGQKKQDVADGPKFLREGGLIEGLKDIVYSVEDMGDIQTSVILGDTKSNNVNYPKTSGAAFEQIAKCVNTAVSSGAVCVTLGGDHSIAIGTIAGHAQAREDLCVIWVDAHADINPPLASQSGNLHGMPLAFLIHELKDNIPPLPGFEWLKPCLNAKNLAYIGLRDVDPAEKYIINSLGITCFTSKDVDREGIDKCIKDAIKIINPSGDKPIHLSFDIDACDPVIAASTGTPVAGGLTLREALCLVEHVAETGCLSALDLVEVNPKIGTLTEQLATRQAANEIIFACFGKRDINQVPKDYMMPQITFFA